MKKVLLVSCEGLGRGGVQAVMMAILRNLKSEYQFDVLLFTDEVRYYEEEVLSYGAKIFRVPFYEGKNRFRRRLDYYIRAPRLYRGIRKALRQNGPYDVIHCNNGFESALCLKAAEKAGIPVRIVHNHVQIKPVSRIRSRINARYMKIIHRLATHFVACSPSAGQTMFGSAGGTVIYNSYDEQRFTPGRFEGIQPEKLTLLQIGSYSDNKNQRFSLEVLRAILDQGVEAHLDFVGFGDEKTALEERTAELGLTEFVQFHPADADTPALLSQSAALMFPSKYEGFGIVLVEAQAMGVGCYVSDSVPKDADVGGCVYLPLSAGAQSWAERIIADYQRTGGVRTPFDCAAFSTETVINTYRKLYRGEKL